MEHDFIIALQWRYTCDHGACIMLYMSYVWFSGGYFDIVPIFSSICGIASLSLLHCSIVSDIPAQFGGRHGYSIAVNYCVMRCFCVLVYKYSESH